MSFEEVLRSTQDIHLLNIALLVGTVILVYQYVWQVAMLVLDFFFSVFVLPFSVGRLFTVTVGYYCVSTLIVTVAGAWVDNTQHTLAVVLCALTVFSLVGWEAYDRYVPTSLQERQGPAWIRWINLLLAPLWTGICVGGLLGAADAFFPYTFLAVRGLALLDSYALVGLLVRFIGMFTLVQTLVRGVFSVLGMFDYAKILMTTKTAAKPKTY